MTRQSHLPVFCLVLALPMLGWLGFFLGIGVSLAMLVITKRLALRPK